MSTARGPGLGTVLAKPAYRHLFAAQTISRWGDTFNTVALVVLVFRLTGSGLGVTGAVIAEIAPVLLLAPLAGAVIDRLPRVRVLIAADLWRMALACLLPLVDQHLAAVYAVAFGLAAGGVFFNPAASSLLPSIVEEDELVAANSGLWSAAVISQIALAPLAGALVAAVGVAPAFLVNAASFAVSALLLVGLRLPGQPPAIAAGSWLARVGEGARLLVRDRLLRLLALVQLLAALSAGATSALLVVLAGRQLHVGPGGSACCWPPSGSAPPSGRCCWPGWSATRAGQHGCSGRCCCVAWSTWCWPAPAAWPSPWGRWPPMGWGPPPGW
jgi:MFS family permease